MSLFPYLGLEVAKRCEKQTRAEAETSLRVDEDSGWTSRASEQPPRLSLKISGDDPVAGAFSARLSFRRSLETGLSDVRTDAPKPRFHRASARVKHEVEGSTEGRSLRLLQTISKEFKGFWRLFKGVWRRLGCEAALARASRNQEEAPGAPRAPARLENVKTSLGPGRQGREPPGVSAPRELHRAHRSTRELSKDRKKKEIS